MKKKKLFLIIACSLIASISLAVVIPFAIFGIRSLNIKKDYSHLLNNAAFSQKVEIEGMDLVTQHISCGYASIEMISSFYGKKVSEDDLDAKNKSISTSTSRGFLKEINKSIPSKKFVMHSYLGN